MIILPYLLVYSTSQRERESHSVLYMDFFAIHSLVFYHLELLRTRLPKLTPSIPMEVLTIAIVLIDQFFIHIHQPIKAWLFAKKSLG